MRGAACIQLPHYLYHFSDFFQRDSFARFARQKKRINMIRFFHLVKPYMPYLSNLPMALLVLLP